MRTFILLTAFMLVIPGCTEPRDPVPSSSEQPAESTMSEASNTSAGIPSEKVTRDAGQANESTEKAAAVDIHIKSFDEVQQMIAAAKGRVVIVDYWSTSCESCKEEFPHLVALSRKYPAEKLLCLSASLDFSGLPDRPLEKCRDEALEFLKAQQAAFSNIIFREDDLTILDEKLKTPSIPIVVVYGKDGAVVKQFDESNGGVSYEKVIIPLVDGLLKE